MLKIIDIVSKVNYHGMFLSLFKEEYIGTLNTLDKI